MANRWHELQSELAASPRHWVVTGAAGFIGSNLVERLLKLGQQVVGLDNFGTGHQSNLDEVKAAVRPEQWARFEFVQGDIGDASICGHACAGAEIVLHQAALGSVPWSMEDPMRSHNSNVTGFLSMLIAARKAGVKRFVYASSSAVYGDSPELPKREPNIGAPLSPYAATKLMNEAYATTFTNAYNFSSIGLRYFNVFGPRQDPEGAYAAVIPKWIASLIRHEAVFINGDGDTSRDFCYVDNVVQANLLAGVTTNVDALNQAYNVAVGGRTTLNELFDALKTELLRRNVNVASAKPTYRDFRAGDVRHSLANIDKAKRLLGYEPEFDLKSGLTRAFDWYLRNVASPKR
jgi:UDP-N-acetylglucosamine 4-epimerase